MINLVPEQIKKKLKIEYWVRVVSVWLILWSFALVVCSVILLPVYVLINSQVDTYESSVNEASQKVANYEIATKELSRSTEEARLFMEESRLPKISSFFDLINQKVDDGVSISEISIDRREDGVGPARIEGVANDRRSFASFRESLLSENLIEAVDFPISTLERDRDIVFSITVTFNSEKNI